MNPEPYQGDTNVGQSRSIVSPILGFEILLELVPRALLPLSGTGLCKALGLEKLLVPNLNT